jgi:hypothetical protein
VCVCVRVRVRVCVANVTEMMRRVCLLGFLLPMLVEWYRPDKSKVVPCGDDLCLTRPTSEVEYHIV